MGVSFVHLSDIHFGQAAGGRLAIHDDIRIRLIEDIRCMTSSVIYRQTAGIIVTGDIAFSGKEHEYQIAAEWLDNVAEAAGCAIHDIQVVPGNHDIDRDTITEVTKLVLEGITRGGDPTLDRVLATEDGRELLFRRFSSYRPFAEAYRCPVNLYAGPEERIAQLAPGRSIRFVRLNSALLCSTADEQGTLLLGARQRALQPREGEELVVLCHHPLHWLQDSEDAMRFIRNRARVFMSGHEHRPSLQIKEIRNGSSLMMLAAGATVPPAANQEFTYRYNFVEFDWDSTRDGLSVSIHPRVWIDDRKRFGSDDRLLSEQGQEFVLGSPYFRSAPKVHAAPPQNNRDHVLSKPVIITSSADASSKGEGVVDDDYAILLLRFFRDLSSAQRKSVLVSLCELPSDWTGPLNETLARRAFDRLVQRGRLDDLRREVSKFIRSDP